MLKSLIFFSPLLIFAAQPLPSLNELITKADGETLIVFKLDNTLIRPIQHLGSEEWLEFEINRLIKKGFAKDVAAKRVENRWTKVQRKTRLTLLEKGADKTLQELAKSRAKMVAITTRKRSFIDLTKRQLRKVKLHLGKYYPFSESLITEDFHYHEGVLFCPRKEDQDKALSSFLEKTNCLFSKIIYIDNEESQALYMEKSLNERGIANHCYHYLPGSRWADEFDAKATDLQWKTFNGILSDQEAKKLAAFNN